MINESGNEPFIAPDSGGVGYYPEPTYSPPTYYPPSYPVYSPPSYTPTYTPPAGTVGGSSGNYGGAGGYVGGYSAPGTSNLSGYTGVGSGTGYQSFTQQADGSILGLGNLPFSPPTKPYKKLGGITAGGNALIQALQSIFGSYQAGQLDSVSALTQATQVEGYLDDPNVFFQARHGKDASALENFKQQAQSIVNAIASWVKPTPPTTTPDTPAPTTPTSTIPAQAQTILDQLQTLLGTGAPSSTNFQAPPNLYQVTPDGSSGGAVSGGSNMQKIIILAVVAFAAYWLYKKYA